MVYKLVEVDGIPVEKRSSDKESHGGRKQALRTCKATGTILEEIVHPYGHPPDESGRALTVDLVRDGEPVCDLSIDAARQRVKEGLHSLPWDGLKLSKGEPAIPTRMIPPAARSEHVGSH
jgi:nicotinate phosphoribosyltransferase